jgi:Tol biopolymer transport system component
MAGFLPDGRTLFVTTRDAEGRRTTWVVDSAGGEARRLPLPPGRILSANTFSPDGRRFVASCPEDRSTCVYDTVAGTPRPLAGAEPGSRAVAWDDRGRIYLTSRTKSMSALLFRVDAASGRAERVAELSPRDPAGVLGISRVVVARAAEAWAFGLLRRLSDLYVATGVS